MKRKSLFLVGTVFSALALIGGTLAASWAVTDNANEISVKVSPGTISQDTATKSVVLDWGTNQLVDIQNLEANETKGPYKVQLLATTSSNESYTGTFSVKLTSTTLTGTRLIDNLTVAAYGAVSGTAPSGDALVSLNGNKAPTTGSAVAQASAQVTVTNATAKDVYLFVTLGNVSSETFETIKSQEVTLSVGWDVGSDTTVVTSRTIYYKNTSSWTNVYAYAWKSSDGTNNAWPGVKMDLVKDGIYTVSLDTTKGFDKVIFNDGVGGEGKQTTTLTLDTKPYWDGDSWEDAPNLSADTQYYLVGTFNDWTTGSPMTKGSYTEGGKSYTYKVENVSIAAGGKLKVVSSTNTWYGEHGASDGDMTIGEPNSYDFFFNPEPSGDDP